MVLVKAMITLLDRAPANEVMAKTMMIAAPVSNGVTVLGNRAVTTTALASRSMAPATTIMALAPAVNEVTVRAMMIIAPVNRATMDLDNRAMVVVSKLAMDRVNKATIHTDLDLRKAMVASISIIARGKMMIAMDKQLGVELMTATVRVNLAVDLLTGPAIRGTGLAVKDSVVRVMVVLTTMIQAIKVKELMGLETLAMAVPQEGVIHMGPEVNSDMAKVAATMTTKEMARNC